MFLILDSQNPGDLIFSSWIDKMGATNLPLSLYLTMPISHAQYDMNEDVSWQKGLSISNVQTNTTNLVLDFVVRWEC
jgi:hypothetical protein